MKRYNIKPGFRQREEARKREAEQLGQWAKEWVEGGMQMGHSISCSLYERKFPTPTRKKRRGHQP